jgi:hypothetical protein
MTTPKLGPQHFEALKDAECWIRWTAESDAQTTVSDLLAELPAILRASEERIKGLEREVQSWETKADFWRDRAKEFKQVADGQKLWLWQNGDHYLAFAHEYPCYEPTGDPMTLGEPIATALFRRSFDRSQAISKPHLYTSSPDHGEDLK